MLVTFENILPNREGNREIPDLSQNLVIFERNLTFEKKKLTSKLSCELGFAKPRRTGLSKFEFFSFAQKKPVVTLFELSWSTIRF